MWPLSVYKLKLAIMASCKSRDKNNNCKDDLYQAETKNFPSAAKEGNLQTKWKNINAVQWRIALILCMLMGLVVWCVFHSQAKIKEGTYFFALLSGKLP